MNKSLRKKPEWVPDKPARIETPMYPGVEVTEAEAKRLDDQMKANHDLGRDCWRAFCGQMCRFRDGQGWKRLKFKTLAGYLGHRFGFGKSQAYRLIDAVDTYCRIAKADGLLPGKDGQLSPSGEKSRQAAEKRPVLPDGEGVLRPIAALKSSSDQINAWAEAKRLAMDDGAGDKFHVTEKHTRAAVKKYRQQQAKADRLIPDDEPDKLDEAEDHLKASVKCVESWGGDQQYVRLVDDCTERLDALREGAE